MKREKTKRLMFYNLTKKHLKEDISNFFPEV